MDFFASLTKRTRARILTFSRDEEDIRKPLQNFDVISLAEEGVNLKKLPPYH